MLSTPSLGFPLPLLWSSCDWSQCVCVRVCPCAHMHVQGQTKGGARLPLSLRYTEIRTQLRLQEARLPEWLQQKPPQPRPSVSWGAHVPVEGGELHRRCRETRTISLVAEEGHLSRTGHQTHPTEMTLIDRGRPQLQFGGHSRIMLTAPVPE